MTTTTVGSSLEHVIGPDGLVKIRLRSGEIRLRAVDGESVRVRDRDGHDLATMFTIDLGQGSADLSSGRDSDGGRRRSGHAAELEVHLPRRSTLVVETTSAEIIGDGLLGDQRYRTTSGEVTLRAAGGRITIDAVSGDVDIVATDEAEMAVRTMSGDVAIRAATLVSLRATTTSGDLKVAGHLAGPGPCASETVSGDGLLAPAGDLRIEMTTMSGDLSSDLGDRVDGGRGRRSLSIGTAGPALTYRSMSGDLHVVRPVPVPTPAASRPTAQDTTAQATPAAPAPPVAPAAPVPPAAPGTSTEPAAYAGPAAVANGAIAAAYDDARLRILRSLERGEIDVAEAGRRFEALDAADPVDPSSETTRIPTVDPSGG
jgi:hypothetical protein